MEPPQPQVNTFIKKKKEDDLIDPISKVFIVSQNLCGLNRGVGFDFMNSKLLTLAFIYAVALNTGLLYFISQRPREDILLEVLLSFLILQNFIIFFLSIIFGKRMRRFFELIGEFDREINITPRVSHEQIAILAQVVGLFTFVTALFIVRHRHEYLLFHINYYFETHFYGHLISLLFQRVRLINNLMETPVTARPVIMNMAEQRQNKIKSVQIPMNKLMDYYQVIVRAFEVLTDAIKWQFVTIVTTAFFLLLAQFLKNAFLVKAEEKSWWSVLPWMTLPIFELLSLLVPCVCCDLLRAQVRRLRELVAFKIYENKLDKSGRSNARALLALTDTSNLSFSLLRVINVSISLPFKLVGLLITYLIIFLQFQKVIGLKNEVKT